MLQSQTDTEVIIHLFEQCLKDGMSLQEAALYLSRQLEGAFACIIISRIYPDCMVLIRKRSPLCIGIGEHEMFAASDLFAFAGKVNQVCYLPDESIAFVRPDGIELVDFNGDVLPLGVQPIAMEWQEHGKLAYEHFMLKEMYEQKTAIANTLSHAMQLGDGIWDAMGVTADQVEHLHSLSLIGCGTSWHAARIAQFFFEGLCRIPVRVHLASEMRYMPYFPYNESIAIALSQSGETADTLEALRLLKMHAVPTVALSNVPTSTMVREAGGALLTQAGHEVAVASTKAFTTQLTMLYWLAHRIAVQKGLIGSEQMAVVQQDLLIAAERLDEGIALCAERMSQGLAARYACFDRYIFLGRHIGYPFAMEAALKLKEISYIFSQCYPAGELKHGPLALVDNETPVVIFSCMEQEIYQKLVANAQEVKSRGGHIVVFAFDGQDELCRLADTVFVLPRTKPLLEPFVFAGVMQYFTYAIAKELGCEIDTPRNLAKSVTVE